MNIHIIKMHSAYETYIRSLHATEKGALLEFCTHVAEQLLEYEFEKEEVAAIRRDSGVHVKQDKTATDTLKFYKEAMDELLRKGRNVARDNCRNTFTITDKKCP